jgi:beta propeller repeat protein
VRTPLTALIASICLALGADAAPRAARVAPGVVVVKLRADDAAALARLRSALGGGEPRALFARHRHAHARIARAAVATPEIGRIVRLALPAGVSPEQAAAQAAADPAVEWASPDLMLVSDFVPDDPYLFSSGSWGQPYADLWGLERIHAQEAWAYTRGEGAVIAVVDSGLDYMHPDMADNVWVNPGEDLDGDGRATDADRNGVDDDGNGFVDDLIGFDFQNSLDANGDGDYDDPEDLSDADPFDDGGHGTHVSGTAAAVGGNGIGMLGVAPRAKVMALKSFPASGSAASSVLARAIVYAADNGADVINTSWSCPDRCSTNPLIDEAVAYAHALGTVVVDSAGNRGDDVVFYSPEKSGNEIVVAASNEDDSHAPFSNVGFLLDVTAPGAGLQRAGDPFATRAILSLLSSGAPPQFSAGLRVGTGYLREAGTSMSAPHVAGVVALVRSLHPDMTPDDVRALLRATARDVGPAGHDRLFGAGIVDALAAVTRRAPQVRGVFADPQAGAVVDARAGTVHVRGSAEGGELASYALAFGHGIEPAAWQPIATASGGPVHDGVLAEWDVSSLDVGAYVLRLELSSTSGDVAREFLPISLERNLPYAISSGGPAFSPDVSGDVVVWDQQNGPPLAGRDVYAKDLRRGSELPVALAAGDQRFARVSGRRIAFLDRSRSADGEVATCELDRQAASCDVTIVATGPGRRNSIVPSGDRIFWLEDAGGTVSPRLCDLGAGAESCVPRPVAVRTARQQELDVSGLRLVWRELVPTSSVWSCVLDPATDACPAELVNGAPPSQFAPALSSGLFAWQLFSAFPEFGIGSQVQVCRLDPNTGACPALPVGAPTAGTPAPDVSGDVVVWSAASGDEAPAIWFCEHDDVTGTCPAQRLTGAAAGQGNPAVSGRRIVFEDARDGPNRIYGFDLPELLVHGSRRVREGAVLVVLVQGRDPAGTPMSLAAELPGGIPVERLGMRFRQIGDGPALLSWRPPFRSAGTYTVLLRGTTQGRLVTREALQIEVEDRRRH